MPPAQQWGPQVWHNQASGWHQWKPQRRQGSDRWRSGSDAWRSSAAADEPAAPGPGGQGGNQAEDTSRSEDQWQAQGNGRARAWNRDQAGQPRAAVKSLLPPLPMIATELDTMMTPASASWDGATPSTKELEGSASPPLRSCSCSSSTGDSRRLAACSEVSTAEAFGSTEGATSNAEASMPAEGLSPFYLATDDFNLQASAGGSLAEGHSAMSPLWIPDPGCSDLSGFCGGGLLPPPYGWDPLPDGDEQTMSPFGASLGSGLSLPLPLPLPSMPSMPSMPSVSSMLPVNYTAFVSIQVPAAPVATAELPDRVIIEALSAPASTHRRLLLAAARLRSILATAPGAERVELYGSLALVGSTPGVRICGQEWWQDWVKHYIRSSSDIDVAVLLKSKASAEDIVRRLLAPNRLELVSRNSSAKFATTQFALRTATGGHKEHQQQEVRVDLTCIDSAIHYEHFKCRQEGFRQVFRDTRAQLETAHGLDGALAFDAYIFLLRAWAAQVPHGAISGFQATCLGIFAVQMQLYQLRSCAPTGLVLFECFLRFCCAFFGDDPQHSLARRLRSYKYCTIDISMGGRLLPRLSRKWRCEVYIMALEVRMQVKHNSRMNVAHSLRPESICAAARETLGSTTSLVDGKLVWS